MIVIRYTGNVRNWSFGKASPIIFDEKRLGWLLRSHPKKRNGLISNKLKARAMTAIVSMLEL